MMSGPVPVLRRHLYSSTALGLAFAVLGSSAAADSLPNGGQTVSGSVVIGTSGSTMTVTQGSEKAIVNWNGFSVGQGNSVNFVQPGTSSAILNRVTGNATSAIAGSITRPVVLASSWNAPGHPAANRLGPEAEVSRVTR